MDFFKFLKKIKNRRFLVSSLIVVSVMVFGGSVFGLAKTGKLATFADEVVKTSRQIVLQQADTQYGSVYVTLDSTNTGGGGIALYSGSNPVSATGYYSGNGYYIPSLAYGTYQYYFAMPGNGQPCVGQWKTLSHYAANTYDTYPLFSCGTPPVSGTFSIDGYVSFVGNPSPKPTATIYYDGDMTKFAVTDSSGRYHLSNLPYNPAAMADYAFSYSASGYVAKYGLKLQGDLHQNPYGISSGETYYNVNVQLKQDIPSYRFSGIVKSSSTSMLDGVAVKVIDKAASNQELIQGASTNYDLNVPASAPGENYATNQTPITNLTSRYHTIALQFSKSGYITVEKRIDEFSPAPTTTLYGSGSTIYTILRFPDVTMVQTTQAVYLRAWTDCTDVSRCPNRASNGNIDRIPIVITAYSDQLTTNAMSHPSGTPANANMMVNSLDVTQPREIWINPTNHPNYQPQYTTAHLTSYNFASSSYVPENLTKLAQNTNYVYQSDLFDFQGQLVEPNSSGTGMNPTVANIRISCEDETSTCAGSDKFGSAKYQQSTSTSSPANGTDKNFLFSDLYNIAKYNSGVDRLAVQIDKTGYYLDTNNNSIKDAGEDGRVFLNKSDITPPTTPGGKSVAKKTYALRLLSSSQARIYGTIKATDTNSPLAGTVKLDPINANGGMDTSHEITTQAGPDGKYDFSGLLNSVDRSKTYWLTASPNNMNYSQEMITVRLNINPVLNINFTLSPNSDAVTVFKGYVQNVLADGTTQNVIGAEVKAAFDGFWTDNFIDGTETVSGTHQYQLPLSQNKIFGSVTTGSKSIILTGYNGPSSTSKHRSYKFTIQAGRGTAIRCDFLFNPNDPSETLPPAKTVQVHLTQQTKAFKSVSNTAPELVNQNAPTALPGVPVQLTSYRNDTQTNSSGMEIRSAIVTTGQDGVARFPGWPQQASKIWVTIDNNIWTLDGNEASLNLPATTTSKTLNYWKINWDPNRLMQQANAINMQQCDARWTDRSLGNRDPQNPYYIGDGIDNTICGAGCCTVAYSMAVKFYYQNKTDFRGQSAQQKMDPTVVQKIINETGVNGLAGDRFAQVSDVLNSRFGTHISTKAISISEIDSYLKAGIPVEIWQSGGLVDGGGHAHGAHCVLIIGKLPNGLYRIDDSASSVPVYDAPLSRLGNIQVVFAIMTPDATAGFKNMNGRKTGSTERAYAAGSVNENASLDRDYTVSAEITSSTVSSIEDAFLVVKRQGTADLYLKADKNGNTYTATIPKYLIGSGGFSYKFVAINSLHAQIESPTTQVQMTVVANTPAVAISRAFSALSFQTYVSRINLSADLQALRTRLATLYQSFRDAFATYLQRTGIRQSSLVSVSGQVVNASGQKMPNVLVKIWEDATLSEDGKFTVANVRKGTVTVAVINQLTGKAMTVVTPTMTVSKAMTNYNLRVVDPTDVGSLDAHVFWSSTPRSQMVDGATIQTGRIQLVNNGVVKKTLDLSSNLGHINTSGLQVGDYTANYISPAGASKPVWFDNAKSYIIHIFRSQTTQELALVSDTVSFNIHITSQNGAADCHVWWWGHIYVTMPDGGSIDLNRPPQGCSTQMTGRPGTYSFRMVDNYGRNRVISPASVTLPQASSGTTVELKL